MSSCGLQKLQLCSSLASANVTAGAKHPTAMPSTASLASTQDASDDGYDSDEERKIAQQEWEESIRQLNLLVSVVLLPYFGKWLGRRWSHWGA